jgi:hypothetical protein
LEKPLALGSPYLPRHLAELVDPGDPDHLGCFLIGQLLRRHVARCYDYGTAESGWVAEDIVQRERAV